MLIRLIVFDSRKKLSLAILGLLRLESAGVPIGELRLMPTRILRGHFAGRVELRHLFAEASISAETTARQVSSHEGFLRH